MPTARIGVGRLREFAIVGKASLFRVYGQALRERGFHLPVDLTPQEMEDLPMRLERSADFLTLTQEVPGRLPNNDPRIWPLLSRLGRWDGKAAAELLAVLLSEGDDRAEVLRGLEVSMPENMPHLYVDHGLSQENDVFDVVPSHVVAERELCGKVLLLMGGREEVL